MRESRMSRCLSYSFTLRIGICIFALYVFAQLFIDQQNALYELRRKVPKLEKELIALQEQVEEKEYELQKFSSPTFLLEQMKREEFSGLEFSQDEYLLLLEESIEERE
jgi:cell division protein FtsL